jgi:hypothetical protein
VIGGVVMTKEGRADTMRRAHAQRQIARLARQVLNSEKGAECSVQEWIKKLLADGLLDDPHGRIS